LLDHKGSENELQILFSKIYFSAEIDTVVRKKALTQISFVYFIEHGWTTGPTGFKIIYLFS